MKSRKSRTNKWYKIETTSGSYYTPYGNLIQKRFYIGNGTDKPTPKEIVDHLDKNNKHDFVDAQASGSFFVTNDVAPDTEVQVPNGIYLFGHDGGPKPERLIPFDIRNEKYINLTDLTKEIKSDVEVFKKNESIYRQYETIYKLGFFMYGPPGNGKSALIRNFINTEFKEDAITIFFYDFPSIDFLQHINKGFKDRLKVFVFEEFATAIKEYRLSEVLSFLDGEYSVDKSIVFATTNHPEQLPENVVDRPGRFDKRYKIGNPNDETRRKMLSFYLSRDATTEEVEQTKGLSIAALKDVVFNSKLKDISFNESVKNLKEFSELVKKEFSEIKRMGME